VVSLPPPDEWSTTTATVLADSVIVTVLSTTDPPPPGVGGEVACNVGGNITTLVRVVGGTTDVDTRWEPVGASPRG
jgi:hypothetical protein